MAATTIAFSDLNSWLASQSANTPGTAYKLNITGLIAKDLRNSSYSGTLSRILQSNKNKYVDLSETMLPDDITSLQSSFSGCTSLIIAPVISNTVTNMQETFKGCTSLTTAPEIPDSVTDMSYTFSNCKSLTSTPEIPANVDSLLGTFGGCFLITSAPVIPNSVTNMTSAFSGCKSLITAPTIPSSVINLQNAFSYYTSLTTAPVIPSSVTNMYEAFYGCTALLKIGKLNSMPSTVTSHRNCFTSTPQSLEINIPQKNLEAWKSITPSDWGLTSTDVFYPIAQMEKWVRVDEGTKPESYANWKRIS